MANELKTLITRRLTLLEIGAEIDKEYNIRREDIDRDLLEVLEQIADHAQASEASTKPTPKRRTKKSPPQPDHDRVAKQYADLEPAATGCLCGCGEHVSDDVNFVRGHQKRLQSIARAVEAGKLSDTKMSEPGLAYAAAQGWVGKDI